MLTLLDIIQRQRRESVWYVMRACYYKWSIMEVVYRPLRRRMSEPKELEEQLDKAEVFVSFCSGLDMPESIRKKAKDYFKDKDTGRN